jgi:hypothetical protein
MAVSVAFDNAIITAQPGQSSGCQVQVRNTDRVVDRVVLDVLGEARGWASVEPPELSLMPGAVGSARIVFAPPRAARPRAGEYPFALRAYSQEDPEGSAIVEGAVTLAPFTDIRAELVPRTSHARRRGRHRLIVDNRGNAGADLAVSAADQDDALEFRLRPDLLFVEAGSAVIARLRADPRRRFLKGPNKSLPFQAYVTGADSQAVTVEGAVLQRQVMPEWLPPLLAIAAAAAAALIALWFLVFKPQVQSAAVDAVNAQTRSLASVAVKASQAAVKADQAAVQANAAASSSGTSANTSASAKARATATATVVPVPVSTLIPSEVAPGKTGTIPYKLNGNQTLDVSDVLLENPAGNNGTIDIRSGTSPLFEFALADFRDLDYHFVQPLVFTSTHPLEITVACASGGSAKCTPALSFSGTITTKAGAKKKLDQALTDRIGNGMRAVAQTEAAGDVVEDIGYRPLRVSELVRDLLRVQSVCRQPEHFDLPG